MKISNYSVIFSLLSSFILAEPKHPSSAPGTIQQVAQSSASQKLKHHKKHRIVSKVARSTPVATTISTSTGLPVATIAPFPPACFSTVNYQTSTVEGVVDFSDFESFPIDLNCWITRMTDPRTCVSVYNYLTGLTICSMDSDGVYVCLVQPGSAKCSSRKNVANNLFRFINSKGAISTTVDNIVDPLVLDMNHNGIVEASAGKGIDLDLGSKPIGAAVNGDKMLAMSALAGNGKIDGRSVFGDKTISPFTKQPYHAKNGFESLRKVALEAEAKGKVKIIKNNSVDMIILALQLEKIGVTLGFVSDNDDTLVEPLYGVKTVNLMYHQVDDNGAVSRKQVGTFEDLTGKRHPIDDVWFTI